MSSVKIVSGKKGWHLRIDGVFICHGFAKGIIGLKCYGGIPYGATEWVSIQTIRGFWAEYRPLIVAAAKNPHDGVEKLTARTFDSIAKENCR